MNGFEFLTIISASQEESKVANEFKYNNYINCIAFISEWEGCILVKFSQTSVSELGISTKKDEFYINGPEECEFIQVNIKEEWCKRLILTKINDYLGDQLNYVNIN